MSDPLKRPTVKELLRHKFIKQAKKPHHLTELIERRERFLQDKSQNSFSAGQEESISICKDSDTESVWDFGTIKGLATAKPRHHSISSSADTVSTTRSLRRTTADLSSYFHIGNRQQQLREALDPVFDEINKSSASLTSLKEAFREAEEEHPGVILEIVQNFHKLL